MLLTEALELVINYSLTINPTSIHHLNNSWCCGLRQVARMAQGLMPGRQNNTFPCLQWDVWTYVRFRTILFYVVGMMM